MGISASRASLARLWNQRERAWCRRRQLTQWSLCPGGRGMVAVSAIRCLISGTVSGIMPGSAGGGWSGETGPAAWVSVRSRSRAAVTAQIARAAITRTVCRAIAVYSLTWDWSSPARSDRSGCLGVGAVAEQGGGDGAGREGGHHQDAVPGDRGIQPDLGLVQPELVLPEFESFFYGPPQAGCADQPGLGAQLPFGDVAVMEGQLAGPGVAADQQVMLRRGCADPRPRVPPVALGALAGGPDLPAALVLQQRGDGFGAGQHGPAAHRDPEIRGHPQHVRLLLRLEELPQLRAVAVYLVPAREVELDAVGSRVLADIDGELALGAELKVQRQPRPQRLHRIRDVLTRYPLPEPDQRVPGLLPHIGQVNRIDSVRDPVRAAHMLTLDAGRERNQY